MLLDKITYYLGYEKNILRRLGLVGLKPLHLEANPVLHRKILEKSERKFGQARNLNNYQRSYAQFYCQEALYENSLQKISATVLFFPLVPLTLVYVFFESFKQIKKRPCDVFIFAFSDIGYPRQDFEGERVLSAPLKDVGYCFGLMEVVFMLKVLIKIPAVLFCPKLIVNIVRWISRYAWVLRKHEPKVIATFFEGSASCSIITEYLNDRGIQHFNYAHGEHFRYDCYSAYGNFNRYTIWGEHFREIQIEKKCRRESFVVRAPDSFKYYFNESRYIDRTQNNMTVLIHSGVYKGSLEYQSLLEVLKNLSEEWCIYLRPHPRDRSTWPQVKYDLVADVERLSLKVQLRDMLPEEVTMCTSIETSKVFIGSASAALLEALLGGCKIIYLQGRAKNSDIFERHLDSCNVLSLLNGFDPLKFNSFLCSKYLADESEDKKIRYLFAL